MTTKIVNLSSKQSKMSQKSIAVFIVFLLFSHLALSQTIHKWRDENGKLHFGDSPPKNTKSEIVTTGNATIYRQEGLNQEIPEVSESKTKTLKREEKKSESSRCTSAKEWAKKVRDELREAHSAKRADDLKDKLRAINTAVRKSC